AGGSRAREAVREAEMATRVRRARPEEREPLAAEHEAEPVAERHAEREIQLPEALLARRAPHRARIEERCAAERAAGAQTLEEGRQAAPGRHNVGGREH